MWIHSVIFLPEDNCTCFIATCGTMQQLAFTIWLNTIFFLFCMKCEGNMQSPFTVIFPRDQCSQLGVEPLIARLCTIKPDAPPAELTRPTSNHLDLQLLPFFNKVFYYEHSLTPSKFQCFTSLILLL